MSTRWRPKSSPRVFFSEADVYKTRMRILIDGLAALSSPDFSPNFHSLQKLTTLPLEKKLAKLGVDVFFSPSATAFITCEEPLACSLYSPLEGVWAAKNLKNLLFFPFFFFS